MTYWGPILATVILITLIMLVVKAIDTIAEAWNDRQEYKEIQAPYDWEKEGW